MRVDGSLKTVTTGVSTVDKTRHPPGEKYMKICDNMRNDQIDGLVRRPPAILVRDSLEWTDYDDVLRQVTDFDQATDILKPFDIDEDRYWLYYKPNSGDEGGRMVILNENGSELVLDMQFGAYAYLDSAKGNDSVRLNAVGDVVYVVNREQEVEMIAGSGPIYDNHSMMNVRFAPEVFSTCVVKWEYPDYTQATITYEVGEDHPVDPIPDVNDVDNGVNTIAAGLATKIRNKVTADGQDLNLEIDQEGSTIVFRNIATGNQQREYSRVVVQDGSGGAFLAINGTVESVDMLPRYSHPAALLEVVPDTTNNRGRFYMRSQPVLEPEVPNPLPTQDILLTPDVVESENSVFRGYTSVLGGEVGAVAPQNPIDAYPGADIAVFGMYGENTQRPTDPTQVQLVMAYDENQEMVPEAVQFLEFWDDSGSAPVRVAQVFMYKTSYLPSEPTPSGNKSQHIWEGTIDAKVQLVLGRDYKVYFSDQIENFNAVPEVRWVEDSAPGEDALINHATFPHVLHRRPNNSFQFGTFNGVDVGAAKQLATRKAGDNISNPPPEFIGKKVRDVATFQNRLALLTQAQVAMSVTGQPHDWWRGTVTQLLDTSPISITSTSTAATAMEHFIEHNNDLMVFSPEGQFRFDGRIPLTPSNASLQQASSYPVQVRARPASAGNNVFFGTTYGASAGLSQFSLDPQIDGLSLAKPMADLQIGLMPSDIQQIVAIPNLGFIAMRLESHRGRLMILEFEPQLDILKPIKPVWSTWAFGWGMDIISIRRGGDFLEVMATGYPGQPDEGEVRLYRLDLFNNRKSAIGFLNSFWGDNHLDCRRGYTGVSTTVDLGDYYPDHIDPERELVVVQGNGCPQPGLEVGYTRNGNILTLDFDMTGGWVQVGYNYTSTVVLPEVDIHDAKGQIQTTAQLRVADYLITLTGHMDVVVTSQLDLGQLYDTQEHRGNPQTDFPPLNWSGADRQTYRAQFRQRPENADIYLVSAGHIAMDIHEVEWRGNYFKAGRRF